MILCGAVVISLEFIRPGRVLPAVAGLTLTAWGVRDLSYWPVSNLGLSLIGLSVGLFALEAFWRVNFLAGTGGACCLAAGLSQLVKQPGSISWMAAVPGCLLFGAWMVFLLNIAKRARRNKWSDLVSAN